MLDSISNFLSKLLFVLGGGTGGVLLLGGLAGLLSQLCLSKPGGFGLGVLGGVGAGLLLGVLSTNAAGILTVLSVF